MNDKWDRLFVERSKVLVQLSDHPFSEFRDWPSCDSFNQCLTGRLYNSSRLDLTFIDQHGLHDGLNYEERINKLGIVSTRLRNWHDFFNALCWFQWPRSKAEINRLHCQDIEKFGLHPRTKRRDLLTHLDESGAIVAVSSNRLSIAGYLEHHQWQSLFIDQRDQWGSGIECFILGHGILEKALNPFPGLTAKIIVVEVEESFFSLDRADKFAELDDSLMNTLMRMNATQQLFPLPLMGIPSWYYGKQDEEFYRDKRYFR